MLLDKEGKSLNPVDLAAHLNPESQASMAADNLGIVRRGLDGAGRELWQSLLTVFGAGLS